MKEWRTRVTAELLQELLNAYKDADYRDVHEFGTMLALNELSDYREQFDLDRAKELAQAEKEGRLVVLPETDAMIVYAIGVLNCENTDCPRTNDEGECDQKCPSMVYEVDLHKCPVTYLSGKTLYLSRAEAEAALAGRIE